MRLPFATCFWLIILSLPAIAAERRCGWYSSPTPGNLMLTDKDGGWWIQMQGRPDPQGIDNLPAFDEVQFVETNVPGSGYGYGCACMTVVTNAKQQRITRVSPVKPSRWRDAVTTSRCKNRTDGTLVRFTLTIISGGVGQRQLCVGVSGAFVGRGQSDASLGAADVGKVLTPDQFVARDRDGNGSVSQTELMNHVMADFAKADKSGDGQLQ